MPQMKICMYKYSIQNLATSHSFAQIFAREDDRLTVCDQNLQSCSAGCAEIDLRSCSQRLWTFDWCCCCSLSGLAHGRRWCWGSRALPEHQSLEAASEAASGQMLQTEAPQAPVLKYIENVINLQGQSAIKYKKVSDRIACFCDAF